MLKKLSLVAVLAGIAFAVPVAAQQAPVSPAPVQRTPIGKTEVPGSNYEVITAMVTIQPGFKAGRHNHPGTVQAQMLEGEFMVAFDGKPEKTSRPGSRSRCPTRRSTTKARSAPCRPS